MAAVSVAVLGGCSGKSDKAATSPPARGSTTEKPAKGGARGTAAPAQVASVDPDKVIARQTLKLRRKPENTVEVGVVSLEVMGKVTKLQLVFTPHFKSVPASGGVSLYDIYEGGDGFSPYLLDIANLKRYDVVRAQYTGSFSSNDVYTETANDTPMIGYAFFAAPQDGATAFDVHVADWWPAFKAVPVQR